MAEESLGRARLDLSVGLDDFRRQMREGQKLAGGMDDSLEALAAVSEITRKALGDVKLSSGAAAESSRIADRIEHSVSGTGHAALLATQHLQEVKIGAAQAAESDVAGTVIDAKLKEINRNANETRRALERVRLAGGRNGVGLGPFGSGFGRVGVFGTAVGLGALTAPAAAPAAFGALATIPTLAAGGVGALGTLALAFNGVGKAIGGDAAAFAKLAPAQRQFVQTTRSLIPWLDRLKQTAGAGMFPGLTEGLRSALSPGTVGAITRAVQQFAAAIGQAGAAWGKYFGSAQFQQIFGPLMQAGARNLAVLSNAALSLFDALGVLGRAAIPLTSWLVGAANNGARLADSWIRAQDASGRLASGMSEAQTSLRLVGGLFLAAGRAIAAFGAAVYPVSKVLVQDLTKGLNALAGIIRRNQATIRDVLGRALSDIVAVVETASAAIGRLSGAFSRLGPVAKGVIVGIGAALAIAFGPESLALTAGVLAAGEIIRHWTQVKTFFSDLGRFMVNVFGAAWSGIKGVFNLGVYSVLLNLEALTKGLEASLGWIPGIGGKIKHALSSVDGFIESFHKRGVAELAQAGADMGNAWGNAFTKAAQHFDSGHGVKSGPVLNPPPKTTKKATAPLPGTHAWYLKNLGYDPTTLNTTGSPFGTAPAFDKNVTKPKKKAPPLLPSVASHALDLATGNANKASNLGNVGAAAERYLGLEITDLQTAARLIRAKYESAAGKARTELFHALTGVLNKIRTARGQLRDALYQDKLASTQFALDLAQLAMDNAKEGSAAYKRAELHEEKLLRAEISYLDKRVRSKKLSLALRQDALTAEISARQQLSSLLGSTTTVASTAGGANQAQFLSSFSGIVQHYAPNAGEIDTGPTDVKHMGAVATKSYEMVNELRQINEKLGRILTTGKFPASDYAVTSAQAAFG